ncbi:hypothetical protein [Pseudomonas sp. HY7a-MNA-CIBAN-0227]|uniref:hypothetical protein n=1 Tax=Pseudomonas sp. HY7a-MNA-CIBAN-0227 TaxID=3140474 RepID=UPI003333EF2F
MNTILNKIIVSVFTILALAPNLSTANTLSYKSVPDAAAAINNEAFPVSYITQYANAYHNHKALMDVVQADYTRCMSTESNVNECDYFKALGTENVNAILDRKISSITRHFTE